MDAPTSQPAPRNPLTAYLLLLQKCKRTLPKSMLVCVSASPSISTTAALLRLAYAVGPFIAVLQVHADIIDDWSPEAARKLAFLAKRFGFLIWEGGRVLNFPQPGRSAPRSGEEISRDIHMARKRYTNGVVSVATWAGLVSSWMFEKDEQDRGGDRLVPTLRRAAREAISSMTMSVRTEITGGINPCKKFQDKVHHEHETFGLSNGVQLSAAEVDDADQSRKTSVISLTHTITQRTEPSVPSSPTGEGHASCDGEEDSWETASSSNYPPPPLLSRGLLISLTDKGNRTSGAGYRSTEEKTAWAHSDFVAGFVTDEPWNIISMSEDTHLKWSSGDNQTKLDDDEENECYRDGSRESTEPRHQETFFVFAPLEPEHLAGLPVDHTDCTEPCSDIGTALSEDVVGDKAAAAPIPTVYKRQIRALHQLVAQALSIQKSRAPVHSETGDSGRGSGMMDPEIIYIPVISMNA